MKYESRHSNINDQLQHYGILGMHWGIRKYQNPDGTLTPKGKIRYGNSLAANVRKKARDRMTEEERVRYDKKMIDEQQKLAGVMFNNGKNDISLTEAEKKVNTGYALANVGIGIGGLLLGSMITGKGNVKQGIEQSMTQYKEAFKFVGQTVDTAFWNGVSKITDTKPVQSFLHRMHHVDVKTLEKKRWWAH